MEKTRLIEEYLDGTLGESEKRTLEEKAAGDPDLSNLIRLHKEVNEGIRDDELIAFYTTLKTMSPKYFSGIVPSIPDKSAGLIKLWHNKFIRFAAVLLLVVSTGLLLKYSLFRSSGNEELFKKYYMTYEADVVSRSAVEKVIDLESAILSYSQGDFAGALTKFNEITVQDKNNHLAWYYRGLTLLETNETSGAIQSFRAIPASWNSPYNEHREWYLALALLRHGNVAEALNAFNRISSSGGYYAKRAKKVSHKIRS